MVDVMSVTDKTSDKGAHSNMKPTHSDANVHVWKRGSHDVLWIQAMNYFFSSFLNNGSVVEWVMWVLTCVAFNKHLVVYTAKDFFVANHWYWYFWCGFGYQQAKQSSADILST